MEKVTKNKRIIFVLTNLAFQTLVGQVSAYAMCKPPMALLFGYDEVFLGILEAVTLMGSLIGSIAILFMPFSPVNGLLGFCVVNALAGALLFLPRYIGIPALRDFILVSGLFIQFFCMSSLAYTQIIFSQYYDENSEKYEHSIWYSCTFLGDIASIMLVQFALYNLNMQWEWAKMLWALYVLLIAVLMYFYLDDHSAREGQIEEMLSIEDEDEGQKPQGVEIQNGEKKEVAKKSKTHECFLLARGIWKLLREPRVFMVVLSFGLIEGLFLNLVYWLPYYYVAINAKDYSMVSLLGCSGCLFIGGIIVEYLLFDLLKLEKYSKKISYFLLVLCSAFFFWLWLEKYGDLKLQIILICVSSFLLSCPYNRVSTVEPMQEAGEDPHRMKMIFLLAHLSHNITAAACTLIIGFLMKIRAEYFWHVVLGNVALILLVETIRKVCMKHNPKDDEPEKIQ